MNGLDCITGMGAERATVGVCSHCGAAVEARDHDPRRATISSAVH